MIEFKDLPNTTTPINAKNLNNNFKEILNIIYPINRVVIFHDNEDHSNYCGFTWERTIIGKVPVGIDSNDTDFNTIGKTGGEKTHSLTWEENGPHNHAMHGVRQWVGNGGTYAWPMDGTSTNSATESGKTSDSGSGKPHNNLQPYQVVAYWKRIS